MEKVIILDFGGQYAHLIANRVRRLGVYSEIHDNDTDISSIQDVKGIILSGGPDSVYDKGSPQARKDLFDTKIPILGLCYGHQIIATYYGGKVASGKTKEYGIAKLSIKESSIFKGLNKYEQVWMSHGDTVSEIPKGFSNIGSTEDCENAAMQNQELNRYGFQFHPEVTHTTNGMKILSNFIFNICKCEKNWNPKDYTNKIIQEIQKKVNSNKVFMLVSGGVDSTVAFTLLNKAIGENNVYGLFIDNGLLRKYERELVDSSIKKLGYKNFHTHDASELFISRLKDVYDPEKKRKIIGDTFIDVQKQVLDELKLNPDEWLLGQGTIYPDTIETKGTKNSDLIKTHHNRVPQIQKMIEEGKIIEPFSQLYKDEVREVGEELGLSKELVWRHPFPGPGLGVRCLCSDSELKSFQINGYETIAIKSVGVQGDARTYRHPAIIKDKKSWEELGELSTKITNENKEINRVILLIKSKTDIFNTKKAYITKERLDKLRDADKIAMDTIKEKNLFNKIWQMPTVLAPIGDSGESIILRPVYSKEAMTAEFAKIDMKIVKDMAKMILKIEGIDAVFYDITNKPPGTIEWE